MKLRGSAETRKTKDKNGKNVPQLEIAEVILFNCNIVNNKYQHVAKVVCPFVPNKSFGQLLVFQQEIILTQKNFIQIFHSFKYGLHIKSLFVEDRRQNKFNSGY